MRRLTFSRLPGTAAAGTALLAATATMCSSPFWRQLAVGRSHSVYRDGNAPPYSRARPTPAGEQSAGGGGAPVYRANSTNDDELSSATRAAMRDDAIILSALFRHIPKEGAISVKSLSSQLPVEVQEALSEMHGGLSHFLAQRKQFFLVKPRPGDNVLFVAANPLAAQKFAVRDQQQNTMRQMLGLYGVDEKPRRGGGGRGDLRRGNRDQSERSPGRSGSHSRETRGGKALNGPDSRRSGSGGGGGGFGRNNQPQQRGDQSYPGGRSTGGGGGGGRPRDGSMGRREQSFGSRGGR